MNALATARASGDLLADRRYAYAEALLAEGDWQGAADLARQVIERVPLWVPGWLLLGGAQEKAGTIDLAIQSYERAGELDGSGLFGARLHADRLLGRNDGAMPAAYVRALFDDYAPRFDRHLIEDLGYRGPKLLVDALDRTSPSPMLRTVLDLGCGTGLMGAALAGRGMAIDGVDLSPGMIANAEKTGFYRTLATADLLSHVAGLSPGSYDLVLAADVLVYVGALGDLFDAVANILRPGGLLAFTVQHSADAEIRLGDDLRYAHSADYVRGALARAGLHPAAIERASTRRDRGVDVPGLVVVAKKP